MDLQEDFSIFTKTIKLYEDLGSEPDNIITIHENSNMNLGSGSRIWECGMILSKYFIKQTLEGKLKLKNKRILELGGGTGYLSIVLGALGSNVICSDLKEILPLMRENIKNNQEIIKENKGKVDSQELDWGFAKEKIIEVLKDVDALDYIVGTDVIFNKGHLTTFSNCAKNIYEILKEKNKGEKLPDLLLCYKSRNEEIDEDIVKYLEEVGFEGNQIEEKEMDKEYMNKRVDIFSLSFRA